MTTTTIYIAFAPSGVHFGNCFLGASYTKKEAKRLAGRSGHVRDFPSVDAAIKEYPEWEEDIHCDL